ncbi:hypothetical protein, partial [Vibrio sinaloensis]|uniref:hypothetical protein n=1 Tax=Photobacterium sp. (strain ATCC 43367) TaxID=379097 RepID=UPI0022AE9B28
IVDADGSVDTATVTITINGHTDAVPTVTVTDSNGLDAGHNTISEDALTAVEGSFSVSAEAGIQAISIEGTSISLSELESSATTPITIATDYGTLRVTGFDNGVVSYSYIVATSLTHTNGEALSDQISITVTDDLNQTSAAEILDIRVTDTAPTATNEVHSVTENASQTISGDTMTNEGNAAFDGSASFKEWGNTDAKYGTFTPKGNGTYT